jgi:hypothetical protein
VPNLAHFDDDDHGDGDGVMVAPFCVGIMDLYSRPTVVQKQPRNLGAPKFDQLAFTN